MRDRLSGQNSSRKTGQAEGEADATRCARFARDNAIAIARAVSLYFASRGERLAAGRGATSLAQGFGGGLATRVSSTLDFRYVAIEGPAGVGKSLLADRLGARLDATVVLDDTENPFLGDFYGDRPGAAFQAQLFFTLSRHRQQTAMRQSDLFSQLTVSDYLFDRDKIYAHLNLDDNEMLIYQRLYQLLAEDVPTPDLVIFLQTPTDILRRRLRDRERANPESTPLDDDYVREMNEAYNHFFFHYAATPLLVVETSEFDLSWGEDALGDLERQLRTMGRGTRYYVPRK